MYTFEKSVFINRSQQEVFEFFTDPTNNRLWQPTTVSACFLSDGPPGVGSRIRSVVKFMGRPMHGEAEVTDWEPFSRYGFKGSGGGVQFAGLVRFEPQEAGTLVTLNGQIRGVGVFKLLEGFIGQQTAKQDGGNYEALKRYLEASQVNG